VHCQNSTSRCLISSVFLTHDSYLMYDSLNLVINAFSSGCWRGMVQEKGSRERRSSWVGLAHTMHVHQCTVFLKENIVICDVFELLLRLTFVEIVRHPITTVH